MKRAALFLLITLLAVLPWKLVWSQQGLIPLTICGPKDKLRPAPDFLVEIAAKYRHGDPIAGETWWVIDLADCDQDYKPTVEEESWFVFRDLPSNWRGGGIGVIIAKSDRRVLKTYWSR